MRSDLTDVTVVLDRSGSMASCQKDAEGGLNEFVRKQKELPGECLLTLVQFDTKYEFVHTATPIKLVGKCSIHPRGNTALLDAMGRAITEAGERLRLMDERDRPGLVVFVVITDGEENSSREYTKSKIKEMIETQQNIYSWQFMFLGANQDAFREAAGYGISDSNTYQWPDGKPVDAFNATSGNLTRMRAATSAGDKVTNSYTDEEKAGVA